MITESSSVPKVSRIAGLSTLLSITACYGTLAFVSFLSFLGITITIHTGLWAGVITIFAWLAAAGVVGGFRQYHAVGPLIVAVAGAVLVTWAMFVSFSRIIEVFGFSGLILAAVWQRYLRFPVRKPSG